MTPFRFHREARAEQQLAVETYTLRSLDVGDRFERALSYCLRLICDEPETWPLWRGRPGIRSHRVRGFPYRMIYVIRDGRVFIVAVAHGRRRPGYWLPRLPRR